MLLRKLLETISRMDRFIKGRKLHWKENNVFEKPFHCYHVVRASNLVAGTNLDSTVQQILDMGKPCETRRSLQVPASGGQGMPDVATAGAGAGNLDFLHAYFVDEFTNAIASVIIELKTNEKLSYKVGELKIFSFAHVDIKKEEESASNGCKTQHGDAKECSAINEIKLKKRSNLEKMEDDDSTNLEHKCEETKEEQYCSIGDLLKKQDMQVDLKEKKIELIEKPMSLRTEKKKDEKRKRYQKLYRIVFHYY
ncbi:unnamed protein product [Cochlearia groenlandica]